MKSKLSGLKTSIRTFLFKFISQFLFLFLIISLTILALSINGTMKMQQRIRDPGTGCFCIFYFMFSPLSCSGAADSILFYVFLTHLFFTSFHSTNRTMHTIISSFFLFRKEFPVAQAEKIPQKIEFFPDVVI